MNIVSLKSTLSRFVRAPIQQLWNSTLNFSVPVISQTLCRNLSVTPTYKTDIEKHFVNRNPRNLEFLGIAWRRKGWKFQYPSRAFYHRIVFERTNRHTAAYVEHCSGAKVISASTKELAIARHLYSNTDQSAAENIGRVLAQRCRECGITATVLLEPVNSDKSEKFQTFKTALFDGGVDLTEPEEVAPDYEPGIDYSNEADTDDLLRRQKLVYKLGTKSRVTKVLNEKRKLRHRRRPLPKALPLEAPAYTFT